MPNFTFQIETAYRAKRPQDLDCVGLLERLRMAFVDAQRMKLEPAKAFGRRVTAPKLAQA